MDKFKHLPNNQDIAKIISNLLQTMFKEYSMQKQLKEILNILSKLPWLDPEFKAGIFLVNKKREFILVADENFNKSEKQTYSRLSIDECYFGQAILENKVIYSIENSSVSSEAKKHYSIPLYEKSKVLGVIVIYLELDHIQKKWETIFLDLLSSVLSSIISKRVLDERFKINQFKTEYHQRELLHKLVEALEFKGKDIEKHIKRVREDSVSIAEKLNLSNKDIELLSSGKQFDPRILKLFLDSIDEVIQVKNLYSNTDIEAENSLDLKQFDYKKDIFVSWNESLSTGITIIDNEHKYLIKLMNDLYYSIHEKSDITIVLKAIKNLREYTFIHFRDEEKYMLDNGYKKYETHIKLHKFFEYSLEEFENDVMDMPFLVGFEILDFLKGWLVDHILIADKEISI